MAGGRSRWLVSFVLGVVLCLAVWIALRPVGRGLRDVGVRGEHWPADALIGLGSPSGSRRCSSA